MLSGNAPTTGTGAWSVVSGPSLNNSQFSSLTNPAATFTPDGGVGSYVVRWTISNNPCTASIADATITVLPLAATALNFDGVNDYISVNNTLGNFGSSDFTIEMKVKTTADQQYILSKRPAGCGSPNFISLAITTGGYLSFEIAGTAPVNYS